MNVLSLEYVGAVVSATKQGAVYDPTSDEVLFAFKPVGAIPQPSDWQQGIWETDPVGSSSEFVAKILVGPGGTVTLPAGTYVVWLQIVDNPEVPVLEVGRLTIDAL